MNTVALLPNINGDTFVTILLKSILTVIFGAVGFDTLKVVAGTVNVLGCHESVRKKPWVALTLGSVPFTIVSVVFPVEPILPCQLFGVFLHE
jgi:hypothetical protein